VIPMSPSGRKLLNGSDEVNKREVKRENTKDKKEKRERKEKRHRVTTSKSEIVHASKSVENVPVTSKSIENVTLIRPVEISRKRTFTLDTPSLAPPQPKQDGHLASAATTKYELLKSLEELEARTRRETRSLSLNQQHVNIICNAIATGNEQTAIALIELKVNINGAGDLGYTPLQLASKLGFGDVVKAILKLGSIDVDFGEEEGCSAAKLAEKSGHLDVLQLLKSYQQHRYIPDL